MTQKKKKLEYKQDVPESNDSTLLDTDYTYNWLKDNESDISELNKTLASLVSWRNGKVDMTNIKHLEAEILALSQIARMYYLNKLPQINYKEEKK